MPVDPVVRGGGPGFQGSETSGADLVLYSNPGDPILTNSGKRIDFDGRSIEDQNPSLVGLSTRKSLQGGGMWIARVKDGTPHARDLDLRDRIVDDDWVDISFRRHNKRWHVMRGLLQNIRRDVNVDSSGTTVVDYTLTGRDFGSIWDKTPLWFNKFITPDAELENVVGTLAMQVFKSVNLSGPVDDTVKAFLFGFLSRLGSLSPSLQSGIGGDKGIGRANWKMPSGIPGVGDESAFIENVTYDTNKFTDDPPRQAIHPNFMDPQGGNIWRMAQEWSDPAFCELWYDQVPINPSFAPDAETTSQRVEIPILSEGTVEQSDPGSTAMAVILRDRPFPTVDLGDRSPWFALPLVEIQRQDLIQESLVRGGDERFNAYFLSSQLTQETAGNAAIEVTGPLWDTEDMRIHGFRRFDIMSRYKADLAKTAATDTALLTLTLGQRQKIQDWYCINPYLWSGTLGISHGRPDVRVGMRLRIPAPSEDKTETFYIEEVGHDWSLEQGIRTTFGVTRGWRGSDAQYMAALQRLAARYFSRQRLPAEIPGDTSVGFA